MSDDIGDGDPPRLRVVPDPSVDVPPWEPPEDEEPEDTRPPFVVRAGDIHLAIQRGCEAVATDPRLFERGNRLVTIHNVDDDAKAPHGIVRARGAAVISPITKAVLKGHLSGAVAWRRIAKKGQSVPYDLSDDAVAGVLETNSWPGMRPLTGIATTPILHRDGTVRVEPGYDEATGLFYAPQGEVPHVKASPSKDDAAAALAELEAIVVDFPFAPGAHPTGWLSALLTPLARPLCESVPMHIFDATGPGTGKGLLADVIGAIVLGRGMSRGAYTSSNEEMRKRILALLLAGDTIALIDNVPTGGAIGWPQLDAALTGSTWTDRILGVSKIPALPNTLTWFATGNNVTVQGDIARRTPRIRLESELEHPEDRSPEDLTHHPLLPWVRAERPRLLGAALTVLSAYLRAGCPGSDTRTLGSFEEWSTVVRSALMWLDRPDVVELLVSHDADADPGATAHVVLLAELDRLLLVETFKASRVLALATQENDYGQRINDELYDALVELAPEDKLTSKRVGCALRGVRGRVRQLEDGRRIRLDRVGGETPSKKAASWQLTSPTAVL